MGTATALKTSRDFYPRSPCGERLSSFMFSITKSTISIHALLAESDKERIKMKKLYFISIHALLAESDQNQHKITVNVV